MLRALTGWLVTTLAVAWWVNGEVPKARADDAQDRIATQGAPGSESRDVPLWVNALPAPFTQVELPARDRVVNPCRVPETGFGVYGGWDRSPSPGQILVPPKLKLDRDGRVAVMFHFHGHESARKQWVREIDGAILFALDLGVSSGPYLKAFSSPLTFERLVHTVESVTGKRMGHAVRVGKIGLSSWSAGYGAVQRILESRFADRIDTVILLDGLHTSSLETQRARITLAPFVRHARRAARGDALMYLTHSSILPPTYASTTATANYLVWQLGGNFESVPASNATPMGLRLIRAYSNGGFYVRGFAGNGKLDHCAQVEEYGRALREFVRPRWRL